MLTNQEIEYFCKSHDYDLRKSGNGRWIDQKCTPDVLWSISDFVLDYITNISETFTVKNIWNSDYAKQTIAETYSKPGTDEKTAENEYDKVFSQPLCMLCYAGVLEDISSDHRKHLYRVKNKEILEDIARNDSLALRFLYVYIERVLKDSDLYKFFEDFFKHQNSTYFNILKQTFINFYHEYTPIKKDYEPKRIFTKVLNPLAFKYSKRGTENGRLSNDLIKKADMMYNRDNFRDIYCDKPKGVSRKEWLKQNPQIDRRNGYFIQIMNSSKKLLRKNLAFYRNNLSELTQFIQEYSDFTNPTQIHHIFPKNDYPEIMYYIENMIALTPNQHFGFAHPNNNTQSVDLIAQKILLIAKIQSIKINLESKSEEHIYDFDKLLYVLSVGWDDDSVMEIEKNDYAEIIYLIQNHYLGD